MLDHVDVLSAQGDLLTLDLENPINGLVVEKIDGLDPVKATLVSSGFAQLNGRYFQASRREPRNLVIQLSLDPNYAESQTSSSLRRSLYPYFMPETEVKLTFFTTDMVPVEISGRVETLEAMLFSKDPTVEISIMCFDPDFIAPDSTLIEGLTTNLEVETLHVYSGTIPTGFLLSLYLDREPIEEQFLVYLRGPDEVTRHLFMNNLSAVLDDGDVVEINTVPGNKRITRVRLEEEASLLYTMSLESEWLQLVPGDNYIRVYAAGAPFPFSIEYVARYGGL